MSAVLEAVAPYAAGGLGAGVGLGGMLVFLRWLLEWIGGRMDKKADRLDRSTQALLDRLEKEVCALTKRVTRAEADLADCKRQHAESAAEVLQLKAILQARGEARERAQLIIAAEKQGAGE